MNIFQNSENYSSISINGLSNNSINLKKNYMKENNIYRNRIIVKMKSNPNILLCEFDISFKKDKLNLNQPINKKYKFRISSNFYKVDKLNIIYNSIIVKHFCKDIGSIIIKHFINRIKLNNLKYTVFRQENITKNLNINIESVLSYDKVLKNFKLIFNYIENNECNYITSNKVCTSNINTKIYNFNNLNDIILRDTINLKINEKLLKLLNNNDSFDISEIFDLKDEIFDFIYFGY